MSNPRPSPLLPWEVFGHIIKANWIQPVDHAAKARSQTMNLFVPPERSFVARLRAMEECRKDILSWMMVCKETNRIASRLYYYCLTFPELSSLVKFRTLVEAESVYSSLSCESVGSLVRYLFLPCCPQHGESDDEEEPWVWWDHMRSLVRLLPNLVVLRSSWAWDEAEDEVLSEMLSCSPRPFKSLVNFSISASNPSISLSFLARCSPTLQYLHLDIEEPRSPTLVHHPTTYPCLAFPSLRKLSLCNASDQVDPLLIPLLSTRWILPSLRSLEVNPSPSYLPFLRSPGGQLRELGLLQQEGDDHGSYEEWFELCPNLEVLAWVVWEWSEGAEVKPVALNAHPPILSVRTIAVAQNVGEQVQSPASWIDRNVPTSSTKRTSHLSSASSSTPVSTRSRSRCFSGVERSSSKASSSSGTETASESSVVVGSWRHQEREREEGVKLGFVVVDASTIFKIIITSREEDLRALETGVASSS